MISFSRIRVTLNRHALLALVIVLLPASVALLAAVLKQPDNVTPVKLRVEILHYGSTHLLREVSNDLTKAGLTLSNDLQPSVGRPVFVLQNLAGWANYDRALFGPPPTVPALPSDIAESATDKASAVTPVLGVPDRRWDVMSVLTDGGVFLYASQGQETFCFPILGNPTEFGQYRRLVDRFQLPVQPTAVTDRKMMVRAFLLAVGYPVPAEEAVSMPAATAPRWETEVDD
jgi:hypothetical protein